jgi:hypothetical protein
MSEETPQPDLVLRYHGTSATAVTIYAGGQAVVHTFLTPENTVERVISLRGGPVVLNTLPPLDINAVAGACTVMIEGAPPVTLTPGASLTVPEGATFRIEATSAILRCTSLYGPGFVPPIPPGGNP